MLSGRGRSGGEVMTTIFCDFTIFGKLICIFLKNQSYDQKFA
jgi:hypothetical protein